MDDMTRHLNAAAIVIEALEPCSRFSLRCRAKLDSGALPADPLHLSLPINTSVETEDRITARLGPDEWLLLAKYGTGAELTRTMQDVLADRVHSLVDISHAYTAFLVSGRHAPEVINGGCPLDLSNAAFPPGKATRTVLGKAEIILLRSGAQPCYRVECARSFGPYVETLLREVAREFGSS